MKKIYLLSIISILSIISACKKDNSIGADILPTDDLLNVKFTDTLTLFSKTLSDTFLRTDKLSKNFLGVINDSKFGFQKASIAMELDKPTSVYDDTLMTTYTVDSVVLFLKYSSVYGDTTVAQSFEVSTIGNKISENSAYYSNSSLFSSTGVVGSVSNYLFTPTTNPVHMSTTDTTGTVGVFRVKLNNSLGNTIINLGQTVLRDSALFKNAFPGILVENASNIGKAMAEIDINSTYSSIAIFFKDKYGTSKDMRLYTSLIKYVSGVATTRVNSVNLFSNTLSSEIQNTAASGLVSDSINYILGQGGSLVRLSLPTLGNLGKIAVNKAVISVTQIQPNIPKDFTTPFTLVFLKRNSLGNLEVLSTFTEQYNEGAGLIDSVGTDILGNKFVRYSINISQYIQRIVKGIETNSDLYLATYYSSGGTDGVLNLLNGGVINGKILNIGYTPSRITIAGSNYSDARYKMKLNLTYTVIN